MTVVALPLAPVALCLSFPPSVNRLHRSVDGKVLSSRIYRAWRKTAGTEILCQPRRKIPGKYHLSILADRPDRRLRDIGNLEKAVSDLLQEMNLIENDCLAQSIRMAWSEREPAKDAKVWVTIEAAA